jgi:hypothetical protein
MRMPSPDVKPAFQFTLRNLLAATFWIAAWCALVVDYLRPADSAVFVVQGLRYSLAFWPLLLGLPVIAVAAFFGHGKLAAIIVAAVFFLLALVPSVQT